MRDGRSPFKSGSPVTRALAIAAALIVALVAFASHAVPSDPALVDFASSDPVLEIKEAMTPYHGPSGTQPDGSNWYLIKATNSAVRPASRVLQATQTPS